MSLRKKMYPPPEVEERATLLYWSMRDEKSDFVL